MTHPYKHAKTGIYWIRKRVPLDLQPLVGKREEKFSLKTRDVNEAKHRTSKALLDIEERWAGLRKGVQTLSVRDIQRLADKVFQHMCGEFAAGRGSGFDWDPEIGDDLWAAVTPTEVDWSAGERLLSQFVPTKPFERSAMITSCERTADALLTQHGLRVDDASRQRLVRATAAAVQQAVLSVRKQQAPIFRIGSDRAQVSCEKPAPTILGKRYQGTRLNELYEGWEKESSATERTRYAWKRVVGELARFVGHDHAADIKQADLVAWKGKLLNANLAPKTIKDGKLAPIRAILEWGFRNGKLESNVATRVTLSVRRKPGETKQGYDDQQAHLLLTTAFQQASPSLKWIPWICATSGARLSEVCQLRKSDVFVVQDVLCVRISPAAGSVKNLSSERSIPLHSALVDLGFAAFVDRAPDGPLFFDMPEDRFGSRGGTATKRIGKWVKSMGIDDKRLSPSHAWRHRFVTLAHDFDVDPIAKPALTGHAQLTETGKYGERRIPFLKRALEKIPRTAFAPTSFWSELGSLSKV